MRISFIHTNTPKNPLTLDSAYFNDAKAIVTERIIPWEGLSRSGVVSETDANNIKTLEKQSPEDRKSTVVSQLELYSHTLLNLLNKLQVDDKNDVVKNILALVNDLLIGMPGNELLGALLALSSIDESLPYQPFLKHVDNPDFIIKTLALYNLVLLFSGASSISSSVPPSSDTMTRVFSVLSSEHFIGNFQDPNAQSIGTQLLQELLLSRNYKGVYLAVNLTQNFKPINQILAKLAKRPNSSGLQLLYNLLLTTWILTFDASITKSLIHEYPDLVGSLLLISKESVKLKIVRVAIGTLKNFVTLTASSSEQFKIIKLILFYGGLATIATLKERKFASNGSDEELSNDLGILSDTLNEIVASKMTSFDEYLTELDNPHLISWSSPMHKSISFWRENAPKFDDSHYKLVTKMLEIMLSPEYDSTTTKVILLNDLQFLIKELGQPLVDFITTEKHGQYKLLIMSYLEDNKGDTELKYQALKTIQLLVGLGF